MGRIWNTYVKLVKQYPYLSQSVQAGTLMAAADVIAQIFVEKQTKWHPLRTAEFSSVGVFLIVRIKI